MFFREAEVQHPHSAVSGRWEHPQLGAPGLPLLAGVPFCSPRSVFHCLAPPCSCTAAGRPEAIHLPEFPVWGCWVTGTGSAFLGNQVSGTAGWGCCHSPEMLPLLARPCRITLLAQGSCHCQQQTPKAEAGHWAVPWGLFSFVYPLLSALFITIIKLWLFEPHESFFSEVSACVCAKPLNFGHCSGNSKGDFCFLTF